MSEPIFVNGLIFKEPHEKSPDFVKGKLSIQVNEFMDFIYKNQSNGWVNIVMKRAKSGKMYFELDTWKPNQQTARYSPANEPSLDSIDVSKMF